MKLHVSSVLAIEPDSGENIHYRVLLNAVKTDEVSSETCSSPFFNKYLSPLNKLPMVLPIHHSLNVDRSVFSLAYFFSVCFT